MNNFLSLLGLASRARKIVTGETLIKKIRTNAIYLVIMLAIILKRNLLTSALVIMLII